MSVNFSPFEIIDTIRIEVVVRYHIHTYAYTVCTKINKLCILSSIIYNISIQKKVSEMLANCRYVSHNSYVMLFDVRMI